MWARNRGASPGIFLFKVHSVISKKPLDYTLKITPG